MRVECEVEEIDLEDENGRPVPSVCIKCSRCDHEATAYGRGERSIRKAAMSLRDDCPNDEDNFYAIDDGGGESRMPDPIVTPWWEKR
jgi:hypothetical protein